MDESDPVPVDEQMRLAREVMGQRSAMLKTLGSTDTPSQSPDLAKTIFDKMAAEMDGLIGHWDE